MQHVSMHANALPVSTVHSAKSLAVFWIYMQAKADGETCRAGANTKVQKWLTEQKASNKVVNTVRRYHEYLPYSLLVQAQR